MHRRYTAAALGRQQAWPPDAVLFNVGLHLLQLAPHLVTPAAHCALPGRYEQTIESAVAQLRASLPATTTMVWRTSNVVCDERIMGAWAEVQRSFKCGGTLVWGEPTLPCDDTDGLELRRRCTQEFGFNGTQCRQTLFDQSNSWLQRRRSLRTLLRSGADVEILDAGSLTAGRCDLTFDGRHFPGLLDEFNRQLLWTLVARRRS